MLRIAVLILVLACLAVAVPPNTVRDQQSTDDDDVLRVNTDLLLFPIRIRDKKGQAIAGLTDQDTFDLSETIAFFNLSNRMASATDMMPNREYHQANR